MLRTKSSKLVCLMLYESDILLHFCGGWVVVVGGGGGAGTFETSLRQSDKGRGGGLKNV